MGLPKHGKTYEVVEMVIAANLAIGRRVVSNIAGLNVEKLREFCGNPENFGELVCIPHDVVDKPGFFPVENHPEIESIVRGGDVVALDEVWRWYQSGVPLPPNHMDFFRLHAHYTHPLTGYTCDIVLITQDIGDLQRKVRMIVSKVFVCQKHTGLGFSKRYLLTVYEGNKLTKTACTGSYQRRYRKEVFPLYLSHSQKKGAQPVERDADSRGVIWKSPFFLFVVPAAAGVFGLSLWYVFHKFSAPEAPKKEVAAVSSVAVVPPGQVPAQVPQGQGASSSQSMYSQQWRVVGSYSTAGRLIWVLSDGRRVRRLNSEGDFSVTADGVEVKLPEGGIATSFSGGAESSQHSMFGGQR
jgi:zona occludens toxin